MSTHSVDVIKIDEVFPHPNADRLEIVKIYEFTCCVRKDDFKPGDLAAYIEPDFVVPTNRPEFSFLKREGRNKERIKAKRLRGVMSQGLLIHAPEGSQEGDNVIEQLEVERYEPSIKLIGTKADTVFGPEGWYPKYDLENWRKYSHILEDGEMVQLTEKLHGCLNYNTLILMADGTKEKIGKLVNTNAIGKEVMAVDSCGKLTTAKITNTFNNGSTEEWLKIKGSRRKASRSGNNYFSIVCTPNHKIWSNGKYIPASKLQAGSIVSMFRGEYNLTPLQKQVLLGKMLGDGFLFKNETSGCMNFSHKKEHEKYVDWTLDYLGDLAGNKSQSVSGYNTEMVGARTVSSVFVREYLDSFYKNKTKIVPEWIIKEIGPIALAFWYMDDGSLGHHEDQEDRANFAVCNFSKFDCEILQRCLKKFDINSVLYPSFNKGKDKKFLRLRLNADDAEKLFLLISPYVPPIMQYKLPERYRGHVPWSVKLDNRQYKPAIVEQKILSIEKLGKVLYKTKFDIETETHNFFASGVLVHNSNAKFHWADNQLYCGSRTRWVGPGPNPWHMAAEQNPWIEAFCKNHPEYTLYGEAFGWVQDLKYGAEKGQIFFRVFDILKGNQWLDWEEIALKYARDGDSFDEGEHVKWVPVIAEAPYNKELIEKFVDGPSTFPKADHCREGIVIKPVVERNHFRYGRVILKAVSNEYLEKGK